MLQHQATVIGVCSWWQWNKF